MLTPGQRESSWASRPDLCRISSERRTSLGRFPLLAPDVAIRSHFDRATILLNFFGHFPNYDDRKRSVVRCAGATRYPLDLPVRIQRSVVCRSSEVVSLRYEDNTHLAGDLPLC